MFNFNFIYYSFFLTDDLDSSNSLYQSQTNLLHESLSSHLYGLVKNPFGLDHNKMEVCNLHQNKNT